MKLSIFTTVTRPLRRLDPIKAALECYVDLADEVVIVDGALNGSALPEIKSDKIKVISSHWPREFDWPLIGKQFTKGYEACNGDFVLHLDSDMIIHENEFDRLCDILKRSDQPALSLWKYQFIQPDRYNLKSRLVVAVNKAKYGDRIKFDSGGDLCQPSLDGQELKPDYVPQAMVPIYNYECILKTKPQLLEDKGRFARAWQEHFGEYKLGGPDNESAYNEWHRMLTGRYQKPQKQIPLSDHPKYIQPLIKDLKPEQWGYSGFGAFTTNNYAS